MRYVIACTTVLLTVSFGAMQAQVRRSHVYPSFEGWEPNTDKSVNLVFGYMAEIPVPDGAVDIPVGPDNHMDPGPDGGQPETFYPRRQKDVFKIRVPADFAGKITWTIAFRGETQKATGSLNPIYALGGDTEFGPATPSGTMTIDAGADQTVTLPATATLKAAVSDKRSAPAAGRQLRSPVVSWRKYRGPGTIVFAPPSAAVVNGSAVTAATFNAPGSYMVQAVVAAGGVSAKDVVAIAVSQAQR
jgi:hypothetical protein